MGPFAAISDCMTRLKRLLQNANVDIVDTLPDKPASSESSESSAETPEPPIPNKEPGYPASLNKEPENQATPNRREETTITTGTVKGYEQLAVRDLSKEVGLNKVAPSSHVVMKNFKLHTYDKDKSPTKRAAKSYCERLSELLSYITY